MASVQADKGRRDQTAKRSRRGVGWPRVAARWLVPLVALAAAVGAALLTGQGIGPITGGVESAAFSSANFLRQVVGIVPVGYAVGAGMVAAFNPCGFALLPSYLGLYLGTGDGPEENRLGRRSLRALTVGGTVTVSFVLLFGIAGVLLSLATTTIARYLPWTGLAVGVVMVIAASRLLSGGTIYASFGDRLADRMGATARKRGLRGYFAYGLGYGLASLSCTLPIFLAVVGSALATRGLLAAGLQFVLYALGMGLVISLLTLGVALFKHAAVRSVRWLMPFVQPLSALLLLAAGTYIVYYWLTIGGLLHTATF